MREWQTYDCMYIFTFVYTRRFTHFYTYITIEISSIIFNLVYLLFSRFLLLRISSTLNSHTHANRDLSAKEKNGRARQKYTHTHTNTKTHAWSCVQFCTCAVPFFYENLAQLNFGASIRDNRQQWGRKRMLYLQHVSFNLFMSFLVLPRVVYMTCVREQQIST